MRRLFLLSLLAVPTTLLVLPIARPVFAQSSSSALIAAELDKLIQLDIKNQPLPQAVKTIEDKSNGVRIDVAPQVYDLLPWGEQTTINAKIENKTLREALAAITRKLGLTFELKDEAVEIQPLPALRRLGRRATVDELSVLDYLSRTPYDGKPQVNVKGVLDAVDTKLESAKSNFAVENRAGGADATNLTIPRNATMLEALEAIPTNTDATWYPWGKSLVVVQKVDQVRNQLTKTVTIRFNGVNVSQVLAELQAKAGVKFTIEPGAVARLAPEQQNVRLVLENASIEQALENLAGFTGLAWSATNSGVYISNLTSSGAASREPSVALLTLDNGLQVVVRESQVPADMREYIKHKTDQQLDKIRQMMTEEGFKPTTKPTTAPATRRSDDL
jgi:hypothetical protein